MAAEDEGSTLDVADFLKKQDSTTLSLGKDDDLEYDIYGWFNFETDAEGVQRLDRKWVPLAAAAAAEDFSDALDAYEARLEAKKKDFQ